MGEYDDRLESISTEVSRLASNVAYLVQKYEAGGGGSGSGGGSSGGSVDMSAVRAVYDPQISTITSDITSIKSVNTTQNNKISALEALVSPTKNSLGAENLAAFHNNIWRGKDISKTYTIDQLHSKVSGGDFSDLYIGDYFVKPVTYNGTSFDHTFRIAGFDTFLYHGDSDANMVTAHHIVLVPDVLVDTASALMTTTMSSSASATGGYAASPARTLVGGALHTALNASSCLNGHILKHRAFFTTSVSSDGIVNNGEWNDENSGVLSVSMILGFVPGHQINPYSVGHCVGQLPLFRLNPSMIWHAKIGGSAKHYWYWTRDPADASRFFRIGADSKLGFASPNNAGPFRIYTLFT